MEHHWSQYTKNQQADHFKAGRAKSRHALVCALKYSGIFRSFLETLIAGQITVDELKQSTLSPYA